MAQSLIQAQQDMHHAGLANEASVSMQPMVAVSSTLPAMDDEHESGECKGKTAEA